MKISCIVLAAGDSSRMGTNKLLLDISGVSLIKKTLDEINKIPFHDVIVVTGFQAEKITQSLEGTTKRTIHNPFHLLGMHTSIKAGVNNLMPDTDAFFVCLADQPYFNHLNLKKIMNHYRGGIAAPTFDQKRGHPVLISRKFTEEILTEPDGDYGCSYLFKRHPNEIINVPMTSSEVITDIDLPSDYDAFLKQEELLKDPTQDFLSKILELRKLNSTFAVATVIEVFGSSSARTGSKAIFNNEGKNVLGWVGGGCAERFIGEECLEVIKEKKTKVILADLDDEIFGLGVACGGKMKVFLDPFIPMETVLIPLSKKYSSMIAHLAGFYGWNILPSKKIPIPSSEGNLLSILASSVGAQRGRSLKSLREVKPVPARFKNNILINPKNVIIIGRTRITEALARHFTFLGMKVVVIGPDLKQVDYPKSVNCLCLNETYDNFSFKNNEIVIIAAHTSQDPVLVKKAIVAGASYIGMIGSLKRSEEVLTYLGLMNKLVEAPLFIPAGLDIDARNPDEIALSVAAEVVSLILEKK